jgi:hypothetical protein
MAQRHMIQTFGPWPREKFERFRAEMAKETGLQLVGDSGTAEKSSVKVSWAYDEATQEVTFQTLSTPFFISEDTVDTKIHLVAEGFK